MAVQITFLNQHFTIVVDGKLEVLAKRLRSALRRAGEDNTQSGRDPVS